MDTLIIGAGIAGLRAAGLLRAAGQRVTVVDKGRRHGGRMATRRVDDAVFDTGVLDFATHSEVFRSEVEAAGRAGHAVAIDSEGPTMRWRGVPMMRSFPTAMAERVGSGEGTGAPVTVRLATTVTALTIVDGRWWVTLVGGGTTEQYTADALVITAPAPQSIALLGTGDRLASDATLARLDAVTYLPSLTVLARPADRASTDVAADLTVRLASAREATTGDLVRVHHNGRTGASAVVALTLHPSAAFSALHLDGDRDAAAAMLAGQASELAGTELEVVHVHGWRYAQVECGIGLPALRDDTAGAPLVLAGDLFEGHGTGRVLRHEGVERAFLSGQAAAALLTDDRPM
jgi:renalase